MDNFYRTFEDRYRGSRELIKDRLRVYLPFVTPLLQDYPNAEALDLGCGRGEWLEVIAGAGFKARGVDLDAGMLSACHERNLSVENQDALTALRTAPDSSLAIISAFHVVEHIIFDDVRALIAEAMRALVPGGFMILETPNPENIVVAGCNFYLDPTHQRPIPPQLLSFAVEHSGFERVKVLRLQEDANLYNEAHPLNLMSVLEGVSPDYAVIGQKSGCQKIVEATSEMFSCDFGLNLQTLANRFSQQAETKAQQAEAKAQQAETKAQQAEAKAQQAETKVQQAEARMIQVQQENQNLHRALAEIHSSRSIRITAPLRWAGTQARRLQAEGPKARSIAFIKKLLRKATGFVTARPRLKRLVISVAERLGLAPRLRHMYRSATLNHLPANAASSDQTLPTDLSALTPRARQIYADLKAAIEQNKGGLG